MTSYKVVVTTGPYEWVTTNEDEADYGLADPLTITRSIPESDFWPAQPSPAKAVFRIIAADYADVASLTEGLPVQVAYYSPSADTDPLEDFAGRIASVVLTPHRYGVLATVTCVDYLADLAEPQVLAAPADGSVYPFFVQMADTIDILWDRSGIPHSAPTSTAVTPTDDPLVVPPFDGGNLAQLVEHYLSQWIWDVTGIGWPDGPGRFVLIQDTDGPDLVGFKFAPIWRQMPSGAWVDTLDVDAALVDLGGSFTTRKGAETVATIEVQYQYGDPLSVTATNPGADGLVRATKPVALGLEADAQKVADFYVPTGAGSRWVADDFTWRLHADAEGAYVDYGWYGGAHLGFPVNINGIDERWCPTGTTYSGVLGGYTLTIAAGRPEIALNVRPAVHLEP